MTGRDFARAQSFWALASEYFESAATLLAATGRKAMPILFLQGHAIELALKSYLISAGLDDGALRGIGHDLVKGMARAKKHGLRTSLSDAQVSSIRSINSLYQGKKLEYFYPEPKAFGSLDEMQTIVKTLLNEVFDHVTAPTFDAMRSILNSSFACDQDNRTFWMIDGQAMER